MRRGGRRRYTVPRCGPVIPCRYLECIDVGHIHCYYYCLQFRTQRRAAGQAGRMRKNIPHLHWFESTGKLWIKLSLFLDRSNRKTVLEITTLQIYTISGVAGFTKYAEHSTSSSSCVIVQQNGRPIIPTCLCRT